MDPGAGGGVLVNSFCGDGTLVKSLDKRLYVKFTSIDLNLSRGLEHLEANIMEFETLRLMEDLPITQTTNQPTSQPANKPSD